MEIIDVEPVFAEGPFPVHLGDTAIEEEAPPNPEVGKCAKCGDPIFEHQARVTLADESMYHPEHVDG